MQQKQKDPGPLVRRSKRKIKNGDSNFVSECKVFVDESDNAVEVEDPGPLVRRSKRKFKNKMLFDPTKVEKLTRTVKIGI